MNFSLEGALLRRPEPKDVDALYAQKNDPEVANALGGFSMGYARADISEWVERHRRMGGELIWVIAATSDDTCLGHVGLYNIDHRIRKAEFAIMLGAKERQGQGLGKRVTRFVLDYAFDNLNLNRVELSLLASNARAKRLYDSLGFVQEGVQRQAQFKNGEYLDVILMSLLRDEWTQH
ncbi:MAG: GNAT family protein [Polyangiaceae bacterium]